MSLDGLGFQGFHSAPVTRETSSTSDPDLSDEYDEDAPHHANGHDDEERKIKAQAKSNRKVCSPLLVAHTTCLPAISLLAMIARSNSNCKRLLHR